MKTALAGIAAIAGLIGTPALAADMPLKAPPPPAEATWQGFYVGINGGGGWANTSWNFPIFEFFNSAAPQGFSSNPSGGLVGGQIGYNFQIGSWVVGAEFAGDWANLSQTQVGALTPVFPGDSFTTKLQDLEAFTLRVGYAPGNWLWYAKAGVAAGGVSFSGISGPPVIGVAFSNTQRLGGPTAGAGVEFMWGQHFILGVEYDYTALGGGGAISPVAACTNPATCGATVVPLTVGTTIFQVQTVTGRISYKF
jgi:outer membrane immunogenic protein